MRTSAMLFAVVAFAVLAPSSLRAQMLLFSERLGGAQAGCLREILPTAHWMPDSQALMPSIAQAAATRLSNVGRAYVYIFEGRGWCGTAGCPLLIGEVGQDGVCRLLYDAFGDTTFTVLRRRDHGYRRIYAPCEARFDGHRYQQVNEDCPSPRAWR